MTILVTRYRRRLEKELPAIVSKNIDEAYDALYDGPSSGVDRQVRDASTPYGTIKKDST
jgi:hypothetical protein